MTVVFLLHNADTWCSDRSYPRRRRMAQSELALEMSFENVSSHASSYKLGWYGLKIEDIVVLNKGSYRQPTDMALCKSKTHLIQVDNLHLHIHATSHDTTPNLP